VNNAKFGQVDNFTQLANNFGEQIEHWNGVDVNVSARMANGLNLSGGTSTGRTSTDNCEILAQLPEISVNGLPYCHQDTNWLTQVKATASYRIRRIDVQTSGAFQSLPGSAIAANWAVNNAIVAPSLGRNLSGSQANTTVNMVEPGTEYGDRLNQFDFRVGKILRFGSARATVSLDLYNAFNASTVLSQNNNYVPVTGGLATWQVPTLILQARFVKISTQFEW